MVVYITYSEKYDCKNTDANTFNFCAIQNCRLQNYMGKVCIYITIFYMWWLLHSTVLPFAHIHTINLCATLIKPHSHTVSTTIGGNLFCFLPQNCLTRDTEYLGFEPPGEQLYLLSRCSPHHHCQSTPFWHRLLLLCVLRPHALAFFNKRNGHLCLLSI